MDGQGSYRVLVAGGCHVDGFRVAPGKGFIDVMRRQVAGHGSIEIIPMSYVSLSSGEKILQCCRELRPDLLILQMGNYECPYELSRVLRRLKERIRGVKSPRKACSPTREAPKIRFEKPKSYLRDMLVMLASPLLKLADAAPYDREKIRRKIDHFMEQIQSAECGELWALSMFPARPPWKRHVRRVGCKMLREAARRHENQYLDVFSILPQRATQSLYTADGMHMNEYGHELLATVLSQQVLTKAEAAFRHNAKTIA